MRQRVIGGIIAFIGLMLSPVTWWNDTFVNIPISYLCANIITYFSPRLFSVGFLLSYWFTNILGIILLYIGGENLIGFNKTRQFITILVYSLIILLSSLLGIIKPFVK